MLYALFTEVLTQIQIEAPKIDLYAFTFGGLLGAAFLSVAIPWITLTDSTSNYFELAVGAVLVPSCGLLVFGRLWTRVLSSVRYDDRRLTVRSLLWKTFTCELAEVSKIEIIRHPFEWLLIPRYMVIKLNLGMSRRTFLAIGMGMQIENLALDFASLRIPVISRRTSLVGIVGILV